MEQYTGECLCGACSYVITGDKPKAMFLCHCSRCRKESGSFCAANVFFKDAQLTWEKGADNISSFKLKKSRKQRFFCKTCGCPLPYQNENGPLVLPAGSLNDDVLLEPTAHVFYESRASWEDKIADLKRFDELPM